jgi:hypothetical protein
MFPFIILILAAIISLSGLFYYTKTYGPQLLSDYNRVSGVSGVTGNPSNGDYTPIIPPDQIDSSIMLLSSSDFVSDGSIRSSDSSDSTHRGCCKVHKYPPCCCQPAVPVTPQEPVPDNNVVILPMPNAEGIPKVDTPPVQLEDILPPIQAITPQPAPIPSVPIQAVTPSPPPPPPPAPIPSAFLSGGFPTINSYKSAAQTAAAAAAQAAATSQLTQAVSSLASATSQSQPGFGEAFFPKITPPINKVTIGDRDVTYSTKNQIKLNCFSSEIGVSYTNNIQHDAIYTFKNIDSVWSNVNRGIAMVDINGNQNLQTFEAKYNAVDKVLTLYIKTFDEKVLNLAGVININFMLADCVDPYITTGGGRGSGCGYQSNFTLGGNYMSR